MAPPMVAAAAPAAERLTTSPSEPPRTPPRAPPTMPPSTPHSRHEYHCTGSGTAVRCTQMTCSRLGGPWPGVVMAQAPLAPLQPLAAHEHACCAGRCAGRCGGSGGSGGGELSPSLGAALLLAAAGLAGSETVVASDSLLSLPKAMCSGSTASSSTWSSPEPSRAPRELKVKGVRPRAWTLLGAPLGSPSGRQGGPSSPTTLQPTRAKVFSRSRRRVARRGCEHRPASVHVSRGQLLQLLQLLGRLQPATLRSPSSHLGVVVACRCRAASARDWPGARQHASARASIEHPSVLQQPVAHAMMTSEPFLLTVARDTTHLQSPAAMINFSGFGEGNN